MVGHLLLYFHPLLAVRAETPAEVERLGIEHDMGQARPRRVLPEHLVLEQECVQPLKKHVVAWIALVEIGAQ